MSPQEFEIALACHYRVAAPGTQIALPEVKLGILPGAGGTQRLPRVVGLPMALDMITSGDPINAKQARETGLIDEIAQKAPAGPLQDLLRKLLDPIKSLLTKEMDHVIQEAVSNAVNRIAGSVSDDEAKKLYPQGWQAPRPYLRIVPQPRQ